ncbi:TPA: hypothetical protein DDZ86_01290 [Candidatus Dependentiae bacterium]|nr:MAG: hypothetical protein UW09_C0004G0139 [candidate division TM6 bacterium GW2011_GWF2_43_87]HBL98260.1 hypothetical protein [Candidatus Dependentiae bacterium]
MKRFNALCILLLFLSVAGVSCVSWCCNIQDTPYPGLQIRTYVDENDNLFSTLQFEDNYYYIRRPSDKYVHITALFKTPLTQTPHEQKPLVVDSNEKKTNSNLFPLLTLSVAALKTLEKLQEISAQSNNNSQNDKKE